MSLTYSTETFTPEMAENILHEARRNLPYDERALHTYSEFMKNGQWVVNGATIVFDTNGRLIDGYHRLRACVLAEQPFRSVVARNADPDITHTIDQHRTRSYLQIMESRDIPNAGGVLRLMSKLIRIENGLWGSMQETISWSRLDRVFYANPQLVDAVNFSKKLKANTIQSTARPVVAYMAMVAGHRDKLEAFMRETGPDGRQSLDSPPRMLSTQIITMKSEKNPYNTDQVLPLAILAFNDFLNDRKARGSYSWEKDFGDTPMKPNGKPVSMSAVREHAPANLGLPIVEGYTGLAEGRFDEKRIVEDIFDGKIGEQISKAAERARDREVFVQEVTITPEMAQKLLEFNNHNRKVQPAHVETIARDIEKGHWRVNAQPICFTTNPFNPEPGVPVRLLNGQHRLHACIAADTPIEVTIASNIPDEAFATYDNHARRAVQVDVDGGGPIDNRVLVSACKYLWREVTDRALDGSGTPSASEVAELLRDHPDMTTYYPMSRKQGLAQFGASGLMTYFIYRVLREHKAWGEDYLEQLESAANIAKENPLRRFRDHMLKEKDGMSRNEILLSLLENWKKYKAYRAKLEKAEIKARKEAQQASLLD